ncbi:TetR family transcriptional regulator [Nocardioides phosphati]|uniref:TetR family transcriptional regulator n=1 Tax=Nocardioides phosphati TaxID=1867775 RepID=A0ABQ2N6E1_9ACTN|nr:TetR family transcriptional regulator [Nocardioides phosphati]GGO86205.1 TetR family transcriptional regulator [Nocardioides phosphati]
MTFTTRERLITAAFDLFEAQGFDATTVDQITTQAGVGRTTFFRTFGTKEDVLFPHHDEVLARVAARLGTATPGTRAVAVQEAARIVLDHYIAEGEVARRRYRLTSSVPALREREIASVERYRRLFSQHITHWLEGEPDGALRAELTATAVITAHNHVLRQWLRGATTDLPRDFERAMPFALRTLTSETGGQTVVVVSSAPSVEGVVADVRRALARDSAHA